MLKYKGTSKKVQGNSEQKSYRADDSPTGKPKAPRLMDKGPGSAFYMGSPKEEAKRLRAEKEVPGALGYKVDVDITKWTGKKK